MLMSVIHSTTDSFQKDVLDQKGLVLVDFHAVWCGPCKFTNPIIEELAVDKKYKDKVTFVKVDVDENNDIASQYNVFSIPTFIIFRDGKPIDQFVGARDKSGFESEIDKFLKQSN